MRGRFGLNVLAFQATLSFQSLQFPYLAGNELNSLTFRNAAMKTSFLLLRNFVDHIFFFSSPLTDLQFTSLGAVSTEDECHALCLAERSCAAFTIHLSNESTPAGRSANTCYAFVGKSIALPRSFLKGAEQKTILGKEGLPGIPSPACGWRVWRSESGFEFFLLIPSLSGLILRIINLTRV